MNHDVYCREIKSAVANGGVMGVKGLKGKPGSFVFPLGNKAAGGSRPLRKHNIPV